MFTTKDTRFFTKNTRRYEYSIRIAHRRRESTKLINKALWTSILLARIEIFIHNIWLNLVLFVKNLVPVVVKN